MTPDEFIASDRLRSGGIVRILGVGENAGLISALYERRAGLPEGTVVQLGSPAVCSGGDPETALICTWYAAVSSDVPSSWFPMVKADYSTYAMIAEMRRNDGSVNDKCRRLLRYHPIWPALTFMPYFDADYACRLINLVVDPRWFFHPQHPHRLSRLHRYLGMLPTNSAAFVYNESNAIKHYNRFKIVSRTWLPNDAVKQPIAHKEPGSFLFRILMTTSNPERGVLTANRKFVKFVREVWLQERHPEMQLFDPERFFVHAAERNAYIRHRLSVTSV